MPPSDLSRPQNAPDAGRPDRTWAERAWFSDRGILDRPRDLYHSGAIHDFKSALSSLFGLARPVVVAIGLRLLRPNASYGPDVLPGWTHTAAIALLVTWPLAWICLIVLGLSMQ